LVGKYRRNYLGENKSKRGSENEKKKGKLKVRGQMSEIKYKSQKYM
jgi:hypothetical protein